MPQTSAIFNIDRAAAKAYLSVNTTATANSPFVFDMVTFDTTGSYNPSTGIYTAPSSGLYEISTVLQINGAGNNAGIFVSINGGIVWFIADIGTETNNVTSGSTSLYLTAGDQVAIELNTNTPVSGGANSCHFSIFKVHN